MARPRDSQRSKLYRAERAALRPGRDRPTMKTVDECQSYVNKVLADAWFIRTFGHHTIEAAKGSGSSSARAVGTRRIELPLWSRQPSVILHEIAHCIRPLEGWAKGAVGTRTLFARELRGYPTSTQAAHGREYAHTFLLLVQHFLGSAAATALRSAYRTEGVKFTAKRVLTPEQMQRLRERGRALAAARRQPAVVAPTEPPPPDWPAGYLGRFGRVR